MDDGRWSMVDGRWSDKEVVMDIKWYTGAGDDGFTGVLGRERVPKYADPPRSLRHCG